jgi:predicted Zn-dependent protease
MLKHPLLKPATKQALLSLVIALGLLTPGCGTNPVTNKRELQLVSESQEIAIGKKNYGPTRQAQGGDYTLDPELTAYVQSVGNKLAAVSDRKLPYEFSIINDSTPNAWAMPGGKIAFNRGLLYELNSEAELAAVMGHEMVHAAARHGAKDMERGILLQGAMIAVGIGAQNSDYANLIVGGAQVGAQLVSTKYGRDAESESDLYGMRYMKKAGYDPAAAVTLQETFVRLSAEHKSNFIDGLFASHPPSAQRVSANKSTLMQLGAGGDMGKDTYAQKVSKLKSTQAAYKAYDEAVKALASKDLEKAKQLINQAIAGEPREAKFQELLADMALLQKKPEAALSLYAKAINMQPDYFKPHVQSGIVLFSLLPTAPAYNLLGQLAEGRGDTVLAMQHYQIAADSKSDIGQQAGARLAKLDLPRNPAKYLQARIEVDRTGNLYAVLQNNSALSIQKVQFKVIKYDLKTGRVISRSAPLILRTALAAGAKGQVALGQKVANLQEAQSYQLVLEAAEIQP